MAICLLSIFVFISLLFLVSFANAKQEDIKIAGSTISIKIQRPAKEILHYNQSWLKNMMMMVMKLRKLEMMERKIKLGRNGWMKRVKRFSRLLGVASKFESCDSSQCNNGATCLTNVLYYGGFECICKTGYYGPLCDQTSEDCMYNPCLNGGICVGVYDGYVCGCPPKFSGTHCEVGLEKPPHAWYTELGLDNYVSFYSFSAIIIVMVCLVVMATFCCFVENKKVELRLKNDQYQKLVRSIGLPHLRDQEFVNSSYFNALNEVFIDAGYRAAALVGWVFNLPKMVEGFLRKRELKKTKKMEKKIDKYYKKRKMKSEWWDLYMKVRDRMRQEEVQSIVGKELKIAMETEMKKIKRNEDDNEKAIQQVKDISGIIDNRTDQAVVAMDAKVPMTTMKEMALNQGGLSRNFVDFLPVETTTDGDSEKEDTVPLLSSPTTSLETERTTSGGRSEKTKGGGFFNRNLASFRSSIKQLLGFEKE